MSERNVEPEPTGWVGWMSFAGVMMLLLGIFHAVEGIVALVQDDYYLVTTKGLVVGWDYTTWGWIQLALGVVVAAAAVGLFAGQTWARVVVVLVALGSAIVNLAFLSAYPAWSVIMVAIDVLVIWAVTVHGAEMRTAHERRQMYG